MALREIGAKLTLEGEAEWKAQLSAADRELKVLKSELAATTAEFAGQADSLEALTEKQRIQSQMVDQQEEKVRALKDAVSQATEIWGENAKRTDSLKISLNNAEAALAKMKTELGQTTEAMEAAQTPAEDVAEDIGDIGDKAGETQSALETLAESEALGILKDAADAVLEVLTDCVQKAIEAEAAQAESVEGAGTALATTQEKIDEAQGKLNELQIAIGDVLLPVVGRAADGIGSISEKLAIFVQENPVVVEAVGGLALGISAVAAALSAIKAGQAAVTALQGLGSLATLGPVLGGIAASIALIAAGAAEVSRARAEMRDEALIGDGREVVEYEENVQRLTTALGTLDEQIAEYAASGAEIGYLYDERSRLAGELAMAEEELARNTSAETLAELEAKQAHEAETQALAENSAAVADALAQLADLEARYNQIKNSVDAVVNGFTDLSTATQGYETTVSEMMAALDSQLAYMETYQQNLQTAKDMGLSDALINELSDGSAQSAAQLEAIVAGGEGAIQDLNAKFAEVQEGKDAFVDAIADCLPGFQDTMEAITSTLDEAVASWNQSSAAQAAGGYTIDGLLTGLSRYDELFAKGQQMGQAFMDGYNSTVEIASPSKAMMRAMDYTLDGLILEADRRRGDVEALGSEIGGELVTGFDAAALSAQITASARPVYAGMEAAVSAARDPGTGEVVALLRTWLPEIRRLANMTIVTETGALIGATAPGMDEALGARSASAGRRLAR